MLQKTKQKYTTHAFKFTTTLYSIFRRVITKSEAMCIEMGNGSWKITNGDYSTVHLFLKATRDRQQIVPGNHQKSHLIILKAHISFRQQKVVLFTMNSLLEMQCFIYWILVLWLFGFSIIG